MAFRRQHGTGQELWSIFLEEDPFFKYNYMENSISSTYGSRDALVKAGIADQVRHSPGSSTLFLLTSAQGSVAHNLKPPVQEKEHELWGWMGLPACLLYHFTIHSFIHGSINIEDCVLDTGLSAVWLWQSLWVSVPPLCLYIVRTAS